MASIWSGKVAVVAWQKHRHNRISFYNAIADQIEKLDDACCASASQAQVIDFMTARTDEWGSVGSLGPCVTNWARAHNLLVIPGLVADMIARLIDRNQPERHGQRPTSYLWAVLGNTCAFSPEPEGSTYGRVPGLVVSWSIGIEDRATVKQRAMQAFSELLDEELEAMEKRVGALSEERRKIDQHMRWFVMRVVGGLPVSRIAELEPVANEDAIYKATVRAAEDLGVDPSAYRQPPGRKRKRHNARTQVRHR